MCGDPYNGPRVHEAGYEGPGKGYANGKTVICMHNFHQTYWNKSFFMLTALYSFWSG